MGKMVLHIGTSIYCTKAEKCSKTGSKERIFMLNQKENTLQIDALNWWLGGGEEFNRKIHSPIEQIMDSNSIQYAQYSFRWRKTHLIFFFVQLLFKGATVKTL